MTIHSLTGKQRGITLLETLIAISLAIGLVGVAAAVAVPARQSARVASIENDVRTIQQVTKQSGVSDFTDATLMRDFGSQLGHLIRVNSAAPYGELTAGGYRADVFPGAFHKPAANQNAVQVTSPLGAQITVRGLEVTTCRQLIERFKNSASMILVGGGSSAWRQVQTQAVYDRPSAFSACETSSDSERALVMHLE